MSDSLQLYGLYPASLLCPWGSPGKNTGVGCQALLQGIFPTQSSNTQSLTSPAMAGGFLTTSDTWEALWPQLPLLSSHPGIWNTFLNFRNIHFKNVCSVKLNSATYFHFPWGQVQIIDTGFTVCIHPLEYWLTGEGHKWDTKGNPFSWVWWRNSQCAGVATCKVRLAVLPEAGSHLFSSHWLSLLIRADRWWHGVTALGCVHCRPCSRQCRILARSSWHFNEFMSCLN